MASRGGGRPPPWVNPNTLRGVTSNPLGVGGPSRSLMAKRDFRVGQARLRYEQQQAAEEAAKTALGGLTSLRQAAETEQDLVATTPQELTIRDEVPNLGSIRSSLTNWEEVPGIQQIPISEFDSSPKDLFYAADDLARVRSLANEIRLCACRKYSDTRQQKRLVCPFPAQEQHGSGTRLRFPAYRHPTFVDQL